MEEIAKRLADRGESVEVLTHQDDPDLPDIEMREGVLVRRHTGAGAQPAFRGVPRGVGRACTAPESLRRGARARLPFGRAVGRRHGRRLSLGLHAALPRHRPLTAAQGHPHPVPGGGGGDGGAFRRIICVSHAEADLFLTHFPSARPRVTVIPNGVDLARITAAEPFPDAGPVVVTGGRLQSYKQIDRIIEAMALTRPVCVWWSPGTARSAAPSKRWRTSARVGRGSASSAGWNRRAVPLVCQRRRVLLHVLQRGDAGHHPGTAGRGRPGGRLGHPGPPGHQRAAPRGRSAWSRWTPPGGPGPRPGPRPGEPPGARAADPDLGRGDEQTLDVYRDSRTRR